MRQVKLRPRNYIAFFTNEVAEGFRHGHWSEYLMHATAIACNITFTIGSACFFTAMPEWGDKAGSTCFLVAALVMMITSTIGFLEHVHHVRASGGFPAFRADQKDMTDKEASSLYLEVREAVEELCYFMGSLAYFVGSILFEPIFATHFKNPEVKQDIWQWATVMFILGSAFFVAASYQNALAISYEGLFTHEAHRGPGGFANRQIVKWSLFATQFGAVLFFSGSFLYQGKLDGCFTGMAPRIPIDQGSLQYVLGSLCYLLQSVLSLARTLILHGQEHHPSCRSEGEVEAAPEKTALDEKTPLL